MMAFPMRFTKYRRADLRYIQSSQHHWILFLLRGRGIFLLTSLKISFRDVTPVMLIFGQNVSLQSQTGSAHPLCPQPLTHVWSKSSGISGVESSSLYLLSWRVCSATTALKLWFVGRKLSENRFSDLVHIYQKHTLREIQMSSDK